LTHTKLSNVQQGLRGIGALDDQSGGGNTGPSKETIQKHGDVDSVSLLLRDAGQPAKGWLLLGTYIHPQL
jgi:hypothetical protein